MARKIDNSKEKDTDFKTKETEPKKDQVEYIKYGVYGFLLVLLLIIIFSL